MTRSRAGSTRDRLVLIVAAFAFFVVALGARDLWNPNEPLYGRAVVEMSRSGDWLVPTVNGEVFAEKPILYYWLALLASLGLGVVDEASLRLPSAICGVIAVLLVHGFVSSVSTQARARWAAVIFATTFLVFWNTRAVQMDLLLTVCVLATVLAVVGVVDRGMSPAAGWAWAGLASGLGFLAKGPVGLVCPALIVSVYLLITGRVRVLWDRRIAYGLILFLVIAVPWFAVLALHGRWPMLYELLYRQNVTRVIAPWDHQAPWWYFLSRFWTDMAPWSALVPLALALPGRSKQEERLDRLAWVWIFALVGFFSLSGSKRGVYLLPAAPAVAFLVSGVVERWADGRLGRGRRVAASAWVAILGLVLSVGSILAYRNVLGDYREIDAIGTWLLGLAGSGGIVLLSASLVPSARRFAPIVMASFLVVLYLFTSVRVLPAMDVYKSARPFCQSVNRIVASDAPLSAYRTWQWRASYVYYADRQIPRIASPEALRDYWGRPDPVYLLVERGRREEFHRVLGPMRPLVERNIGNNHVALFVNR